MSGNQEAFENAMNQGHSAAWDMNWENAVSYYRVAVDEFPENLNALISLALALFELQKYPESLEYYQRAARISPNDPSSVQKIAEIYERMGDNAQASKAFMELAEVYLHNKDIEKAISNWSRVITLDPNHMGAHTRLVLVFERLGRTSEAMVEYLSIASLLQSQGDTQRAIQTIKHALQVVPNSKEANLALSILQSGKNLPNPRLLGGTAPLKSPREHLEVPRQVIEDNQPKLDPIQKAKQKALTMLAELLFEQEEAQSSQARKGLGSIIKGMGAVDDGQADQTRIIHHLSQAIDMQSHGDDAHAASELERAMSAGLENSAAYYLLGFLQSKLDHLETAVPNLQKCVQHEIFGMGARLLLALTLYKMDQHKEASAEYLEALRIADAECVAADQAEELIQIYEPIIETFSIQSDSKSQKRICENISKLLIRPDWREQIQLARQQLPVQPSGAAPIPLAEMLTEATSSQLVESLAKVNQLARANKLVSAMEEAYYALKFAPTYLPLHVCIGDLLIQENRVPEAILKYSIVAKSYSIKGEANRAINLLKQVSDLAPMNQEARNELINILISRGKVPEAIQEYIKLAETYYNQADLTKAGKTYALALRYAQQFNVGRETRLKLMHRMADIDMQSLDWRNAIQVYEQIRTLDAEDGKARDMLFDLNMRLGQTSQAITELDSYLNHLISVNRTAEGLEYINLKIREHQNQPALYQRLAEFYRLLGRKEDAINQLELAKEIFVQAENRKAAIDCVMAILALNPTNASIYQRMLVDLQAGK